MRQSIFLLVALLTGAGLATASAGALADAQRAAGTTTLGRGSELVYENCYEHVGGFRVPLFVIRDLVGSELPAGFAYQTFDPARTIGQLNVVGLDCDQDGHRVTDLFINVVVLVPADFGAGRPTLLRARTYTSSPQSEARYALFCFGNVAKLANVEASVEIDPNTGVRRGRVLGTDGLGSIELRTTAAPPTSVITAATIRHFTVKDGDVHGLIEWGSRDAGVRLRGTESMLVLDGVTYAGFVGQQIFPEEGDPATFFHRGLTRCPPGLDWIQ